MAALPKSVQKQIDEANRIAEEVYSKETPKDQEQSEEVSAEASSEDTQQPEGGDPVSASEPKDSQPTEGSTAQASADPEARQSEDQSRQGDGWEHKYNVLRGKYNAEVPRLQKENREISEHLRELQQRLNDTQALIATMNKRDSAPADQPDKKELDQISDEEIREFGPDLKDFIERVARVAVMPELQNALEERDQKFSKLERQTSTIAEQSTEAARDKFFSDLSREVPGWAEQNEDPKFLEWLDQRDPYAGRTRMQLLTEAYQKLDTPRVVAFFKGFQSENAVVTSQSDSTAPAKEERKQEPQTDLKDYVAPGTPKTGTASAPDGSGKRVWTREDISDLYRRREAYVRKGRSVPEDLLKLERDLHRAHREGRVKA